MTGTRTDRLRAHRQVTVLLGVGVGLCCLLCLGASLLSLALLQEFLRDDFLFFLGLILMVVLLPAAALPAVAAGYLLRALVRMARAPIGDPAGPRLGGMLLAAGCSGVVAGVAIGGNPWAVPIALTGLAVFACAAASFWIGLRRPVR